MEISVQPHAPSDFSPKKYPGAYRTGRFLGPREGLKIFEREISLASAANQKRAFQLPSGYTQK
jgi:hypothetical protein